MPFWAKEREAGVWVWEFRGKVGNSQIEQKEQTFGKFLLGLPETMRHKGETNR